jgi:hypothetical protein
MIKCLGVNLMKGTKDLFNENYKSLKREIEEDIRRWKELPCLWIGRINIVKNSHTTKSNLHVPHSSYQNSNDILHRNRKSNCEIHMQTQKTLNSLRNSEQKVQCWKHYNTQLQTILQRHNSKNRQEDQWIKIEGPDINPCIYSQMIFDKGAQNTWWRKDSLFNKCFWETECPHEED